MDLSIIEILGENVIIRISLIILGAVAIHMVLRSVISSLVNQSVRRDKHHSKVEERKREDTLVSMFTKITGAGLWVFAAIAILSEIGVNFAALLTGAGFLGVIIGIGAQNTIKDFMSGAFIILENQFRVGDIVTLRAGGAEISGIVDEISVRVTRMRDLDGKFHIIPNGSIEVVSNMTFEYAGINMNIGVDYSSDIDKVEKVMNDVGKKMTRQKKWESKIVEPVQFLRVDSFDDSQITIKALGKVEPGSQWEVAGEYRRRLKKAFDENNISIPFPQVVVHKNK